MSGAKPLLSINSVIPNFDAETSQGPINFHEWLGGCVPRAPASPLPLNSPRVHV